MNPVFEEVQPHQHPVQGEDHCSSPAGLTTADSRQDAVGLLGHRGTMITCGPYRMRDALPTASMRPCGVCSHAQVVAAVPLCVCTLWECSNSKPEL